MFKKTLRIILGIPKHALHLLKFRFYVKWLRWLYCWVICWQSAVGGSANWVKYQTIKKWQDQVNNTNSAFIFMINLFITLGCQSGSVGRGGQLVRLVRLVWWSRWSRWSRLSMWPRWSGLPMWSSSSFVLAKLNPVNPHFFPPNFSTAHL